MHPARVTVCTGLLAAFVLGKVCAQAAPVIVTKGPGVVATIGEGFMGLQYNGPTHVAIDPHTGQLADFPSSYAHAATRDALARAGVQTVRVFLDAPTVHPAPGVFDWADTDTAVDEITAAGMTPLLTLHQRDGAWHVGDAANPWWEDPAGRQAWRDLAAATATRYSDRAPYFELLNEPNHLHPTSPSYMGLDRSADLFLDAAAEIHAVAPTAKVGGPAGFGSWEPATWAKRVLDRPGGEAQLDFVSYHVYGTESATATDDAIFDRAKWYESVPQAIRAELDSVSNKPIELALTEFNTSAVWQMNGQLYTDPRNVDTMGGLVAALGWLYSARGGADMALRFGTTGGYGLVVWPAEYELQDAYDAVRLLHGVGGLAPGAELIETGLAGDPLGLEAFTLRAPAGDALVIVNTNEAVSHDLEWRGVGDSPLDLYRYDSHRHEDSLVPLATIAPADGVASFTAPPRSLTVLRLAPQPGDYNNDGTVSQDDYSLWQDQYGRAGAGLAADGNGDGAVDAADYAVWRDGLAPPAEATPEPTAAALAALAAGCASRRR